MLLVCGHGVCCSCEALMVKLWYNNLQTWVSSHRASDHDHLTQSTYQHTLCMLKILSPNLLVCASAYTIAHHRMGMSQRPTAWPWCWTLKSEHAHFLLWKCFCIMVSEARHGTHIIHAASCAVAHGAPPGMLLACCSLCLRVLMLFSLHAHMHACFVSTAWQAHMSQLNVS